ncbi:MAG: hypothetical protein E7268_05355 [Lachnospiraceae bacterium]|nr:hypothetical protein [Lachnospiraceae bacterium]
MKKVFKFFAALASLAAVAGGAYLVYKNFFAKEEEDFDFEDSFDDEDTMASREYVSINITTDETEEEDEVSMDAEVSDEVSSDAVDAE